MNGNKERNIAIDLLKCLLMLMIVLHHCIVHGMGLAAMVQGQYAVSKQSGMLISLDMFLIVAVNVFFLISGYFTIKCNYKKVIRFMAEMLAASVVMTVLTSVVCHYSIGQLVKSFVIGLTNYWFINVYIVILLFSQYINGIIERINDREYAYILTIWFSLEFLLSFVLRRAEFGSSTGYSMLHLLFMYFTGAYLSRKITNNRKQTPLICCAIYFVATIVSICCVTVLINYSQEMAYRAYAYNSPLVIFSSVSLFLMFASCSIVSGGEMG